jgi:lipopolysaccharide export system ATP-binding protein
MSVSITTKDLVKKYGKRTVVNHVSFNVQQGEIVGLLGPNGAGKTTSFYQVVGLVKPDEGKVFLNEQDITNLPMYKRAKMGIGYLPQEASIFRKLTVEDNIKAVLEMTKLSRQQQREKLETLLDEFRLQHVRKSNGDVLSGGERRRTEIARALAVDPKFILLDEPFAGIDPIAVEDIQAIVAKLKYKNIGILITDHNVNETLSICDRAYLLIDGKIYKDGTAEELAADEEVKRLYLGRNFELKRKDYLHEEAKEERNSNSPKRHESNFEMAIEKLVTETDKKIGILSKIGAYKLSTITTDSMDIRTYITYLNDTKLAILSKFQNNDSIFSIAQKIPTIDFGKYKRKFEIYDILAVPVIVSFLFLIGFLAIIPMAIIYRPLFKSLKENLIEARNLLVEINKQIALSAE